MRKILKNWPIVLIILLSLWNRFYNLNRFFVFGVDEEYQAYLAKTIVEHFHIIWIGVGSTVGFYLGPLWTYLTALLLFISNGDPLITGYFAGTLGVATTVLIYYISKKNGSQFSSIISALLYATLPLIVFYDRKFWNVSAIPIVSLLLFLSAAESIKNPRWLIVFSFLSALVFHIHLTLLPIVVVSLIWIISQKPKLSRFTVLICLGIFVLIISPLISFDYFHKGSNISAPLRLIESAGKKPEQFNFPEHIRAFTQSLGRLWYLSPGQSPADEVNWGCTSVGNLTVNQNQKTKDYWQTIDKTTTRDTPNYFFIIFGLIILLSFLISKETWKNQKSKLLALLIIAQGGLSLLFPGPAYEYYFLSFLALYFLVINQVLFKTKWPLKAIMVALFILISMLGFISVNTAKEEYGLAAKKILISKALSYVGDKPFYLKEEGMCHVAEGWRYLFAVYGRKPAASSTDRMFGWIYPKEINKNVKPAYEVIMSETRALYLPPKNIEKEFSEEGFTAYILPSQ